MPRLRALFAVAVLLCCLLVSVALAQSPEPSSTPPAATPVPTTTPTPEQVEAAQRRAERREAHLVKKLRDKIRYHRGQTNYWRGVMFKKPLRVRYKKLMGLNSIQLKGVLKYAKKARHRARYHAERPPMLWAWLCIHSHEASSWDSTSNPKYKGGLQFDRTFELMYNPKLAYEKGRASAWTKWEQIWTAVKAAFWRGRGFGPWPKTRIPCGV